MADATRKTDGGAGLVIGICLVIIGSIFLVVKTLPTFFPGLAHALRAMMGFAWPICIIIAGVVIIVAVRRGAFSDRRGKPLRRSRTNRKIAGICGGLADYLGANVLSIRIIALVLLVASFLILGIVYLIMWAVVPEE